MNLHADAGLALKSYLHDLGGAARLVMRKGKNSKKATCGIFMQQTAGSRQMDFDLN